MKDRWMNMGFEDEELKPFIEPVVDLNDEKRIEMLVRLKEKKITQGAENLIASFQRFAWAIHVQMF